MVYQPSKRSSLNWGYHWHRIPLYVFAFAASAVVGFLLGRLLLFHQDTGTNTETETTEVTEAQPSSTSTDTPTLINLQSVVDDWLTTITGTAGVYIYDLDNNEVVAEYNSSQFLGTASLYKLFVAYEGYARAEQGITNLNEPNYVGTYTRGECLDLMIRASYSPCAETMWAEIGQDELNDIINTKYKLQNTFGLTSTPADIAKMLLLYYNHPDLSAKTWETIKDSMLNQPVTDYDWRQGLPSGFSSAAKVYNKVGFEHSGVDDIWKLYHNAAIVEFPELNRHYIIVVMTSHVTPAQISALATALETAITSKANSGSTHD